MRVLLVHPGSKWSTADVESGVAYGLRMLGVTVIRCGIGTALEVAKLQKVDAVILVTAIRHKPAEIQALLDAGLCVTVVLTESPYEPEAELRIASQVAGCWTHERAFLPSLRLVNPQSAYLPHAWHPGVHVPEPQPGDDAVPAHDVVFVGSGFRERIAWFNAIDWTGINLGLYGIWDGLGLKPQVEACVRGGPISNVKVAALYRRAKIGLNLYRHLDSGLGPDVPERRVTAESLNPRAYELAACGTFQISEARAEIGDVFEFYVPTFATSTEASPLIRDWLPFVRQRYVDGAECRAHVAGSSWVNRAEQMIANLTAWREAAAMAAR